MPQRGRQVLWLGDPGPKSRSGHPGVGQDSDACM